MPEDGYDADVEARQDNDDECFVCHDTYFPLWKDICECKTLAVHPECLDEWIAHVLTDHPETTVFSCSVCRRPYRTIPHVSSLRHTLPPPPPSPERRRRRMDPRGDEEEERHVVREEVRITRAFEQRCVGLVLLVSGSTFLGVNFVRHQAWDPPAVVVGCLLTSMILLGAMLLTDSGPTPRSQTAPALQQV